MTLTDSVAIILSAEGTLFFYVSMLLVLLPFFFALQIERDEPREKSISRWKTVTAILLVSYLVLLLFHLIFWLGAIDGYVVLPILERYVGVLGLLGFSWVLFNPTPSTRGDRVMYTLIGFATLGVVATMFYAFLVGFPLEFNKTLADAIWGVFGLILAAIAMIVMVVRRPRAWVAAAFGFGLIVLGYLLHLTLGPQDHSYMAYVRWGTIFGSLLLVIAGVRTLAQEDQMDIQEEDEELAVSVTYETEYFSLPQVLDDLEGMMEASELDNLVPATVRGVARIMKSEISLLLTPPDPADRFSIAQGYDLISERFIQGESILVGQMPVIANALRQHQSIILPALSRAPDIQEIKRALSLDFTGPILMVPMVTDSQLEGGIMLLSPFARKRWSEGSRQSLQHIADLVAERFRELDVAQKTSLEPEEAAIDEREEYLSQIKSLESENLRLMEQLSLMASADGHDVQGLLQAQRAANDTIKMLEADVERLKAVVAEQPGFPSTEETEQLTDQLQHVLQELAIARAELSRIEQETGTPSLTKEISPDTKAITAIAQDLRRPMASIMGYTDLLLGETVGDLSDTQEEFLTHVRDSTLIMTSMLNDLVHVTAIETGTLDLIPVPVDFLSILDRAVDQTSTALRKKKLALKMDFPNIMPTVLGDEDALFQVVIHLLNNAIGVSPEEGEIAISVRRASMETDEFLTLLITDQGGGIPPEDISRVFDPVYKTEGLTIIGTSESGMGLSIVRALMEAMGGRVWAESKLGTGSTFTTLIPLAGVSPKSE